MPGGLGRAVRMARHYTVWRRFRRFTMVPRAAYLGNLDLAGRCLAQGAMKDGAVVECGTWRGGMAAGLATIGGPARDYHFFDSFAGLPPATAEDGEFAQRAQRTRSDALWFDNNTASLDEFLAVIAQAHVPRERLHVHKGLFADTLAARRDGSRRGAAARRRLV